MLPLKVFIGISKRFECVKGLTEYSIRANTSEEVEIVHLYPEVESGCTGFSDVRFGIKQGIYLDCDMIVLGDIAELASYHRPGKFVCIEDGSTEVAVIDCVHLCRNKFEQHKLPKLSIIPRAWNVEDKIEPGMKLLHFTDLKHQPWFYEHPNADAVRVYNEYREKMTNA